MNRKFYLSCFLLIPTSAFAMLDLAHFTPISRDIDAKTHKVLNHWKGTKASLGYVNNTGNSTTQNINAAGNIQYARAKWVMLANSSFDRSSSSKGLSSQKLVLGAQAQYDICPKTYSFLQGSYVNDKFDGYTFVSNENIGLGRRLFNSDEFKLDIQTGPGLQQKRSRAAGAKLQNLFAWLGRVYTNWNFTQTSSISETLQSNWTNQNTHTFSELALATNIGAGFQTQVSYTVSQDSAPQSGSKHMSTIMAVSIVYNFS